MAFALVAIGLVMIVTGAQATQAQFGAQLLKDMQNGQSGGSSQYGFPYWIAAIVGVGSLGYVAELKGFSTAFLALIIVAMFLSNGGVFQQFSAALSGAPVTIQSTDTAAATSNIASSGGSSTGGNSGGLGDAIGTGLNLLKFFAF